MPLPVDLLDVLGRLDAGTLTQLVLRLLAAEAEDAGLPAEAVTGSERLTVGDAGLDARVDGMPEGRLLPAGTSGFQFKAYKTTAPSSLGLASELRKDGPRAILSSGGHYVLVWPQQLNERQRQNANEALRTAARESLTELNLDEDLIAAACERLHLYDALSLHRLCAKHEQVVIDIGLAPFSPMRTLPELLVELQADNRPFEADEHRRAAIDQLRANAREEGDRALIAGMLGLSGTGKTRTCAEALSTEDLSHRVLYSSRFDVVSDFLTYAVREKRSRGILLVDEVESATREELIRRVGATRGRWRVVTIASILDQARHEAGRRDIVLDPLDPEASTRLVQNSAGLDEPSAQMVAEVAAGFPALAFALAEAKADNPDADLVRLAHLQSTSSLLEKAIPDPELRHALAPLALFQGLGFEDDLAYEFDAVAEMFGHDPRALRTIIDIEHRRSRFVSAAGRYRSVSPTLMAIWLAADLIDRTNDLDQIIDALPEAVQQAFVAQLELMGPVSDQLSAAMARLVESSERFRRPPDFDEAAARLLRAAAAVVPEQAANALRTLLADASPSQLKSMPRRELVTALQRLVWFPSTIDFALDALWLLALHENESWSNNATGSFQDAFNLYLGGTTVDFERRSSWLAHRIEATTDQEELRLLAGAAAKGLEVDYFRMRDPSLERLRLNEWHPQTRDEEARGRQLAAANLLRCLDRASPDRTRDIAELLGHAIWSLRPAGLVDWLADELAARPLDDSARAALLSVVTRGERVGERKERDPAEFARLREVLEGSDLHQRLAIALRSRVWDLAASRDEMLDVPAVLRDLADEVPDDDDAIDRVLKVDSSDVDDNTRFVFLRLLALRLGATRVGERAKASPAVDQAALAACLSVADELGETAWADKTLGEVGTREPALLPLLATYVRLDDRRLEQVLDVIDATGAPVRALGRLVGGYRVRDLGDETAARLIAAMMTDPEATGDALLMADQLLEQSPISEELHAHVFSLAMRSLTADPGTMDEYLVGKLVDRQFLRPEEIAELWGQRMRSREGLVDEVDVRLTEALVDAAPESFLDAVIDHIRAEAAGDVSFSLFAARDLHLLARAAKVAGVDEILARMHALSDIELRLASHHLLWTGDAPHELTARFLASELLDGLESEAFTCFFNTLGVVSGSYWRALERERHRAQLWAEALAASPKAARWASELVRRYDADITQQRRLEAEEDLRLGR